MIQGGRWQIAAAAAAGRKRVPLPFPAACGFAPRTTAADDEAAAPAPIPAPAAFGDGLPPLPKDDDAAHGHLPNLQGCPRNLQGLPHVVLLEGGVSSQLRRAVVHVLHDCGTGYMYIYVCVYMCACMCKLCI